MGVPWFFRVVIYLVPYGFILLYYWMTQNDREDS